MCDNLRSLVTSDPEFGRKKKVNKWEGRKEKDPKVAPIGVFIALLGFVTSQGSHYIGRSAGPKVLGV